MAYDARELREGILEIFESERDSDLYEARVRSLLRQRESRRDDRRLNHAARSRARRKYKLSAAALRNRRLYHRWWWEQKSREERAAVKKANRDRERAQLRIIRQIPKKVAETLPACWACEDCGATFGHRNGLQSHLYYWGQQGKSCARLDRTG